MRVLELAVPFFVLALLFELWLDRRSGRGYIRATDAMASISTGALFTTLGLFTKIIELFIYGLVLSHLALWSIDPAVFDLSPQGILAWLLVLLAWDFCYYWHHRCGHELSLFWAAHSVHHQSEDYNLSTALRQTSSGFLFGWLFYLPLFLIGIPVEVVVTVGAIDLIYQFWVHTRYIGSLGWLDRVFVTPSNHRVHHAQNKIYLDRNYGGILILWDRLFGTFQAELAETPCIYGVRKPLHSFNPLTANLQIYKLLFDDARTTRRWQDKLRVFFSRTGWRPDDCGDVVDLSDAALEGFQRFDPRPSAAMSKYVFFQFLMALGLTAVMAALFRALGPNDTLVVCLYLWALLLSVGSLNEVKASALKWERRRIVFGAVLLVSYFWMVSPVFSSIGQVAIA